MQVTNNQAFLIARALYKGINSGETDVSFSVWGDGAATVGIRKKFGDKYYIYTALNGKTDKSVKLPAFSRNIDIQDLADNVQQALDESVVMQDKDLDTSRKIFQDSEAENKASNKNVESKQPQVEEDDDMNDDFEELLRDEKPTDVSEPIKDTHNDDLQEFEEDLFDEITDDNELETTKNNEQDFDELTEDNIVKPEQLIESTNSKSKGFDIYSYILDESVSGSILDKSKTVARLIADWDTEMDTNLTSKAREAFINLLDSIIQSLMFGDMTKNEASLKVDAFAIEDVFEFVMGHDLQELNTHFKQLPSSHLALVPYKVFSYTDADTKAAVMQHLILRLSSYSTEDFDNIFTPLYREMEEAEEFNRKAEEEAMRQSNNVNVTGNGNDFNNNIEDGGHPNAYYALNQQEKNAVGEVRFSSQLQKQITLRPEEFAKGMNNVFLTIAKNEPDQAEKLYLVAIAIALEAYNGDADALGTEIASDPRDIIMADYEYKIRKKELTENL